MIYHPEDQLSAYIDNELHGDERKQVEEHVKSCESCQALMEELVVMQHEVMQAFHSIEAPAGLDIRVLHTIENRQIPATAGKGWSIVPLLALLALGIIWFTTGAVFVKLAQGCITLMITMVYMTSHFISSVPVLTGLTVVLSLLILTASIYSLRRLLQTTTI